MGRGPHVRDRVWFGAKSVPALRTAAAELAWLVSRGYAEPSSLKLVGDRHRLCKRQRTAVSRSVCCEAARVGRRRRQTDLPRLSGRALGIDGFNAIITVEAALAGGVILVGRDGATRDLASVHGSCRPVRTPREALGRLAEALAGIRDGPVTWFLDRPVSNSGKLAGLLRETAAAHGLDWAVEVVPDPDWVLCGWSGVIATSDGGVLDHAGSWLDLPAAALADDDVWRVDLGGRGYASGSS